MPELPEVETMVRGIRPLMQGALLLDLCPCPCERRPLAISPHLEELRLRVCNQVIPDIERRAKRIVIHFESTDILVFEPRMTGLVLVSDPPSQEHLRFELKLKKGRATHSVWLWDRRGLGTVRLYTAAEFQIALGPQVLGPDALAVQATELTRRLKRTTREVKVALLDQKLVAGVGNLYASEILHEAGINPCLPANRLTPGRILKIHAAMQRILLEAIAYEGSTLNDGTYRNALNKDGTYQNKHRVYAQAGKSCLGCSTGTITRIVQSQRATFFCPQCQRR